MIDVRLMVFGATGGTGKALIEQALAEKHDVVAVVRTPAKLAITHPRLEIASADVFSPGSLGPILTGCDAVLSTLGPRGRKDTSRVCSAGMASILKAMDAAGVRRVVAVSAQPVLRTGAGEPFLFRTVAVPAMRALYRTVYDDMARMEEILSASAADWTVLRPPVLTSRSGTGRYRSAVNANVPGSMTRSDLARAMLDTLADPTTVRRAIGVAGLRLYAR